jgi:hypothetical protein
MSIQPIRPVSFPDCQTIGNYCNNHPTLQAHVATSPIVRSIAPDGVSKIKNYFAGKTISRADVSYHIEQALELESLQKAKTELVYNSLNTRIETVKEDNRISEQMADRQIAVAMRIAESDLDVFYLQINLVVKIYNRVLLDVSDNLTYNISKDSK